MSTVACAWCYKCQSYLPAEENFWVDKSRNTGWKSMCKECCKEPRRIFMAEWRYHHPNEELRRSREQDEKRKRARRRRKTG